MVGRWNLLGMAFSMYEERIYEWLVRSPTFNAGVRRIHRAVDEAKHGRDPNEPLRPGEATAEQPPRPRDANPNPGFFKYFVDEMRNQLRGTPTEDVPPPRRRQPPRR